MNNQTIEAERRIVTCDGCGTPYAAVFDRSELRLVGPDGPQCPNCGEGSFSRLTL